MQLSRSKRCGNQACGCRPVSAHGDHCSAYCANVDAHEADDGACACDHRACAEAQRVPEQADGSVKPDVVTSIGRGPGAR